MAVEWPKDGALGARGGFGVIDGVDEEREPQNIGKKDKFLVVPHEYYILVNKR